MEQLTPMMTGGRVVFSLLRSCNPLTITPSDPLGQQRDAESVVPLEARGLGSVDRRDGVVVSFALTDAGRRLAAVHHPMFAYCRRDLGPEKLAAVDAAAEHARA